MPTYQFKRNGFNTRIVASSIEEAASLTKLDVSQIVEYSKEEIYDPVSMKQNFNRWAEERRAKCKRGRKK